MADSVEITGLKIYSPHSSSVVSVELEINGEWCEVVRVSNPSGRVISLIIEPEGIRQTAKNIRPHIA